jgi:hypothetical protein
MADKSADKMVNILLKEPERLEAIKKDSSKASEVLQKAAADAKVQLTPQAYIIIVYSLGGVALVAAIGAVVLVALGKSTPEVLIALGSAAVGALAGTLMPQDK